MLLAACGTQKDKGKSSNPAIRDLVNECRKVVEHVNKSEQDLLGLEREQKADAARRVQAAGQVDVDENMSASDIARLKKERKRLRLTSDVSQRSGR